jgi:hypothetical protein
MSDDEINRELTHASWHAARPLVLAMALVGLCIFAALAEAGGTVTDSKYIWLQRSGVTLSATTSPPLACPVPKTMTECMACMVVMVDAEIRRRTSGYVTYRCMDVSQKHAKFNTTAVPPVVTSGTADVRWTPPTQKVGGIPLDDLAGYRLVYGTSATALTKTIDIKNPSVTSYVIDQLPPATYYFAVKAYNTSGGESGLGPIAVKAIP